MAFTSIVALLAHVDKRHAVTGYALINPCRLAAGGSKAANQMSLLIQNSWHELPQRVAVLFRVVQAREFTWVGHHIKQCVKRIGL